MKYPRVFLAVAFSCLCAVGASAWSQHTNQQVQEDIQRHEQMAAAHAAAAQCLRAGRSAEACTQALQAACKGLALGKHCGMRHAH